ncbi:TonB-dependent receptor domain-containing protein [Pseudobacteriovorax antillogorgiicola]|uniref:TonB dependent receptor n=1 Tax=Pseudobacteriovorax antillogorgiicola TaxID=1513793 RepID=A0A1Y6BWL5_9BACT|nr:TonB-dependent receptor [Pseudobacteriovorax antillogorgiicola]TCS50226.1 TonB-dependent receptor-like protein [Pseudobacteriovorax antillogorgiicola]SMF32632.1 TonB dependent receptor [Pseudobacteriovorax antillogorgiicola]
MTNSSKLYSLSVLLTALAIPVPSALAQDGEKVERVKVTGSRIKRTSVESSNPKITISRDDLEKEGITSVGDLLRGRTFSTSGSFSGSSGYIRSGSQTANLYGLGPGRTLVLLDGNRLPKVQYTGGTNLENIPVSIIERVEIIAGAKSSIYGSDAVAGVVNIITRKDVEGSSVKLYQSKPEEKGGDESTLSLTNGTSFGNVNMFTTLNYNKQSKVLSRDRDLSYGNGDYAYSRYFHPEGTYSYRKVDESGNPIEGELWQASANCPEGNAKPLAVRPSLGTFCQGALKERDDSELFPEQWGWSATNNIAWEITPTTLFRSFLIYDYKNTDSNYGNYFSGYNYQTGRRQILRNTAASEYIDGLDGNGAEVYVVDPAAPLRTNENIDKTYGGNASIETDIGDFWTLETGISSYKSTNRRNFNNVINKNEYENLFHPSDFNPEYTPIDPNRNSALLNNTVSDLVTKESLTTANFHATISGETPFELPGGPLAVAAGFNRRMEKYKQTPDALDVENFTSYKQPVYTGSASVSGEGQRQAGSIFAEAIAPVYQGIELDASLRFDSFSDFDSAFTYGFGTKIQATSFLNVVASYGTSYRAPELSDIHQEGGGGYTYIKDTNYCEANPDNCTSGQEYQVYYSNAGNKDLKPEEGKSYNIGLILEPSSKFFARADYISYNIKNLFNTRALQDVIDDANDNKDTGPNSVLFEGEGTERKVARAVLSTENLGERNLELMQLKGGYFDRFGDLGLSLNTEYTQNMVVNETKANGTKVDLKGRYFGDNASYSFPLWKWNNTLTLEYDQLAWSLLAKTVSKIKPDPEVVEGAQDGEYNDQYDQFTQYDTSISWKHNYNGDVTFGINNVLNEIGGKHRAQNTSGAESSRSFLYGSSIYGRTFYASLTQRF